jgi:type II secretion system protein G
MTRKNPGFTIVELLVVIVVIGILAAITIVSYSGITSRANIASMKAELSSVSKKLGVYYIDNDQYPADLSTAKSLKLVPPTSKTNETYATGIVDNRPYYCYMYREGTETYAVDSLSGQSKGVCLINLIKNGDFSSGTSNWSGENAAITASSNVLTNTANGAAYYSIAAQTCTGCAINGNIIYAMIQQRVTNSSSTGIGLMIADSGSNKSIPSISNPVINTWYTLSGTVTFTASSNAYYKPVHSYVDAATANGKVAELRYLSMFDLSTTFGKGNELTKAQMDAILNSYPNSWFDGVRKINL